MNVNYKRLNYTIENVGDGKTFWHGEYVYFKTAFRRTGVSGGREVLCTRLATGYAGWYVDTLKVRPCEAEVTIK